MSEPHTIRPDAGEPEFTIYIPAWNAARNRLTSVPTADTRALLASALDQVESGWPAVRGLQLWVQQNRERAGGADDYGCLLTYVEAELREAFRSVAHTLADLVSDWPGWERASVDDVDGWLSAFVRYVTVLVLASETASVPAGFRELVRQVAPYRLGGAWDARLKETLGAIGDRSAGAARVTDAREAVDVLLDALPEEQRASASGSLVGKVESLYAAAGQPSLPWIEVLKEHYRESKVLLHHGGPHDHGTE